jgi:YcxB-like protein
MEVAAVLPFGNWHMKIHFYLSPSDMAAFSVHAFPRTRQYRRNLLICRLIGPLTFFFAMYLFARFEDPLTFYALLGLAGVMSILWLATYGSISRDRLRKRVKKLYSSGDTGRMLGETELDLTPEGIASRNPLGEASVKWGAVQRIDDTKDYVYLFLDPLSAFIIPKAELPDEETGELLVATARRYHEQASAQFREASRPVS